MDVQKFSTVQALILDMDGVLWRADQPIVDLPKVFSKIRTLGLRVILASNNSTLTVYQYLEKLHSFGVHLNPEQIITSGHAAAEYLSSKYPEGGIVFVIGEDGLLEALSEKGFQHGRTNPLAVVVGMDRELNYEKLSQAALLIRSGLPFIGTNPDRTFPMPDGLVPGVGAILACIQAATDVQPVVLGKPQPEMYEFAMKRLGTTPEQTLVVGDRINTDIVGAQELGCRTALVLTGVTGLQEANAWSPPPDWIGANLSTLIDELAEVL